MSKAIDKFREGMSEDGDVDAEVFNDLCDHAELLEEQLAVEKYRVGSMLHMAEEKEDDMSGTIQDRLRDLEVPAGEIQLMTDAANYIDSLETAEFGDPSEWLTFPWGGVVRKSEVVSVEHVHGDLESRCCIQIVLKTGREIEEYADGYTRPEEKAMEWLADLEGQLGVTR